MKKIFLFVLLLNLSFICFSENGITFPQIMLWGINEKSVNSIINPGEIITEAKLTLQGVSFQGNEEGDTVFLNMVRNPGEILTFLIDDYYKTKNTRPIVTDINEITQSLSSVFSKEEIQNILASLNKTSSTETNNKIVTSRMTRHPAEEYGVRLGEFSFSKIGNKSNMIFEFNNMDDPNSPIYKIFSNPTKITLYNGIETKLTSYMLEFIDIAGTSKSFGFLFVPKGNAKFSISRIMFEITVESYSAQTNKKTKRFLTNKAPIIIP